jgi:hypothetical protein
VGDSITTSVQRRHSAVGLGADAGHYGLGIYQITSRDRPGARGGFRPRSGVTSP